MSKYGYIGKESDIPQQAFHSNAGLLTTNDIIDLSNNNKLTQYGQLELIESKTFSGVSSVTFEDIDVDTYNTHFLTYTFHTGSHDVGIFGRFGYENLDGTYAYEDANNQYANQYNEADGTNGEYKSTSMWAHQHANLGSMASGDDGFFSGYAYLYQMGDSTKYSFINVHSVYNSRTDNNAAMNYGGGVFPTAKRHNSYYIAPNTGTTSGRAAIYGIRSY
tara:strand:- start:568 stop:1224 length:657 start_codon:yes stop_codon:yes gene_type:complete